MRTIGTSVVALVGVALWASAGNATPPVSTVVPHVQVAPFVKIVGVKHTSEVRSGFGVDVEVENTSSATATRIIVELNAPGAGVLDQTVVIPAKSTKHVIFADAAGPKPCTAHVYSLLLGGTGADTTPRKASTKGTCTFETKLDQPWNLMTPDRVEDAKNGKLWLGNPAIESPFTCESPLKIKANAINHATKAAQHVALEIKNGATMLGASSYFDVPVKGSKAVTTSASNVPMTTKLDVTVVDTNNSLGGAIASEGLTVTVTPKCTFEVSLDK